MVLKQMVIQKCKCISVILVDLPTQNFTNISLYAKAEAGNYNNFLSPIFHGDIGGQDLSWLHEVFKYFGQNQDEMTLFC